MIGHYSCASTPYTAYVFWCGDSPYRERGVAEANKIYEDGRWWIARVLVQPESMRGRGIGTEMLKRLKREVSTKGCTCLQVAPGGYDSDPRAISFYKKNGFVKTKEAGLYEYHFKRKVHKKVP